MAQVEIKNVTTLGSEILGRVTHDHIHDFVNKVVKPDPVLSKLHLFTFNPDIENDFIAYPIEQKKKESEQITNEAWQHFYDKFYHTSGFHKDCFKFFKWRLEVTCGVCQFLSKFPTSDIPLETIFDHVSCNECIELVDGAGQKRLYISIGKYWPILWLVYLTLPDQKTVECRIHWLIRSPENEIEKEETEWEKESVALFQQLGGDYSEILAGYDVYSGEDSEWRFRLYYFFRGKQLPLSKRRYFEFPIVHRYEPKIKKTAKQLAKRLDLLDIAEYGDARKARYYRGLKKTAEWEIKKAILDLAKKYDFDPKHPNPPGYLGAYLKTKYSGKEIYEKQSVEYNTWPCDEDCKKQKSYEGQLSCRFEDPLGNCSDPEKRRRLRHRVEHSGGSLDEPIVTHSKAGEQDEIRRIENVSAPFADINRAISQKQIRARLQQTLNSDLQKLYNDYYVQGLSQQEIAQKRRVSQSTISRRLARLKKEIEKSL